MTELTNILGKSYKKLKKILRETYDHNLPVFRKNYDEHTKKLWNAKKGLKIDLQKSTKNLGKS